MPPPLVAFGGRPVAVVPVAGFALVSTAFFIWFSSPVQKIANQCAINQRGVSIYVR